jgi:hypothetical protein
MHTDNKSMVGSGTWYTDEKTGLDYILTAGNNLGNFDEMGTFKHFDGIYVYNRRAGAEVYLGKH